MNPHPSRFFYGWIMLGVAILMAAATMPGQTVIVSLFNESYRQALGLSVTQLSAAYTIGTILAAFPITWIGRMTDRLGVRLMTALVAIGLAASLVLLSWASGLVLLGLGFFLVRCLGQGCMSMLAGHLIAMWFERRLGLAHSVLAVAGYALASALLPQPTAWLITEIGWQATLIVLAAFVLILTIPAVCTIFRNKPEDIGQHLDGDPHEHASHDLLHGGTPPPGDPAFTLTQALRTRAYWICTLSLVASGLIGTALIFQMTPMLQTAGLDGSPRQAALAIQPWPIAFGIGTLIIGWLVDRFRPAPLLAIGLLLMGLATLVCMLAARGSFTATVPMMGVGMGLFGTSQAVIVTVTNPTIARYFGRTHHGSIRGSIASAGVAGTGAGPLLAGLGYELAGGSFTILLSLFALSALPMAAGALGLKRPAPPLLPDRTPEPDQPEPSGPVV